jgi:hypothetical protein
MNSTVLWDATPYRRVKIYQRNVLPPSSGLNNLPSKRKATKAASFCLLGALFDPEMEAVFYSEMTVNFYQTAWRHIKRKLI